MIQSKEWIKFHPHILRFFELFHWKVMQEKYLQRPCTNTETHWNSSNLAIFWSIPFILWESNYLWESNWKLTLFPDIWAWYKCYQTWIFIIFKVGLSLLKCPGINISFFCSLLIKLLLLPFCNICYGTFFNYPAFFVSLLNILNMFCTLFCCYHH